MDIFDKSIAIEQAGGNTGLAKDLFTMLVKELPDLQKNLNACFTGEITAEFWDIAHKIHGSTSYCGVPMLKFASKQLEDAIKENNYEQISDALFSVNSSIALLLENAEIVLNEF